MTTPEDHMAANRARMVEPDSVNVEKIARVCHQVTRSICACFGQPALPAWEDAPAWMRDSAKDGVRFHTTNPDASPSASHDNWAAMRIAQGWVYGPIKDEEAKTHPCLVPFEDLSPSQQVKDHVFRAIVHAAALE